MATATKTKALAKVKGKTSLDQFRETGEKSAKPLAELGFGEILKQLEADGEVMSSTELGNGWSVLDSKEKGRLVGVPLLVLSWIVRDGENGEYVSLNVITNTEQLIVNDGSTGIRDQIKALAEEGEIRAIYCKRGLRKSEYNYTDPKTKEQKPAVTFYLDTSA
jgi:hypothetical protein